jgi:hypothetical protein
VLQKPLVDRGRLVGGVVVQDEVEFQVTGHGGVDELEEPQELLVAVPTVGLGDDRAAGKVERCEEAGRAVADVSWVIRAGVVGSIGRQGGRMTTAVTQRRPVGHGHGAASPTV